MNIAEKDNNPLALAQKQTPVSIGQNGHVTRLKRAAIVLGALSAVAGAGALAYAAHSRGYTNGSEEGYDHGRRVGQIMGRELERVDNRDRVTAAKRDGALIGRLQTATLGADFRRWQTFGDGYETGKHVGALTGRLQAGYLGFQHGHRVGYDRGQMNGIQRGYEAGSVDGFRHGQGLVDLVP